jgi:hypothetical protein
MVLQADFECEKTDMFPAPFLLERDHPIPFHLATELVRFLQKATGVNVHSGS